ncbi:MAG: M23 family metallopeptidase, partial [Pseudomonadota bacterium]
RPFKASLDPAAPGDAGDEDAADDAQDVVIDAPDADAGDDEAPGGDPAADDAAGDDPATDGDAAGGDPGDGDAADGGAAPGGEDGAADAGPEPGAGDGPPAGDDDAAEAPDAPDPADPDADAPTDPLAGLFAPPGALTPDSGRGATDATVYAPNIVFPLDDEAYANSQVWGVGGYRGPGGRGQCDPRNYSYPWRDNFCETRSRANERCPAGKGHHGQDIRPATCKKDTHWAVAVEPGVITSIGSYTVTLLGNSGREYRYMHLNMRRLAIKRGDQVTAGQRIGLVSNFFGGTPTTIHLHFEIRLVTRENGRLRKVFVPPYTSLVAAYRRLLAAREGG